MQPLKEVIAALRREIVAALEDGAELPPGTRLEPERVVLSVALALHQKQNGSVSVGVCLPQSGGEGGAFGATGGAHSALHTLTIEFRIPSTSQSASSRIDAAEADRRKTATLHSPSVEHLSESLAAVFGVPGFDSSARATVFREALAVLSDDQARAIADSLRGKPTPGISPAAARARHLITRLVEGGPGGPIRGREILAELLYSHSVQSLVQVVRDKWKTQEHWLDEPVQRRKTS